MSYQPKTGEKCFCRLGIERDNCASCEGTGQRIDFKAIREQKHTPTPWHRNVSPAWKYPIYADASGDPEAKEWIHIGAVLKGNPNAEADLDLIIHAVNNHEKLLSALKTAQSILKALDVYDAAVWNAIKEAEKI